MFKSPPQKSGKRQTKSMGSNLEQVEKYSAINYASRPDTGGGGGEEELQRNKSSSNNHIQHQNQNSSRYRRRTADDFLLFCQFILDYTKYDQMKQQDLRRRHSSSPSLGSTGSGNESLPRSSTSGANDLEEIDDDDDSDDLVQRRRERGRLQGSASKRMTLINKKEVHRSRKSMSSKFTDGAAKKLVDEDETPEEDNEDETPDDDEDDDDEDEEEGEDWNQVTCYCGRPFAGRPMIECTRCLTWVHLKCAKLTRQRIPETWFCQKCKSLKGNDVISDMNKTTTSFKGKTNDVRKSLSPVKTLKTIRPSIPTMSSVEKISGSRKRKLTSRRQKLSTSLDDSTKSLRLSSESELSRYPSTMMHDEA